MAVTPMVIVDGAAAVLLVGLAAYAAVHRPRTPASLSLALLAIGLAPWRALSALREAAGSADPGVVEALAPWTLAADLLYVAAGLGFAGLGASVPSPLDLRDRATRIGLVLGLLVALLYTFVALRDDPFMRAPAAGWTIVEVVRVVSDGLVDALFIALVFLLIARATARGVPTAHVRSMAILAFGLHLFAAGSAGDWVGEAARTRPVFGLVTLGILAIAAAGWLLAARGDARRIAIAAALGIAGLYSASTLIALAGGTYVYSLGSLLAVFVLGHAALSGQIPGIDAKVRVTISRSTVAAVFIAVFFVTSEGAQQFFGEQFQSQYLGIAAAGLLVLAIAPLQRLADRIADHAVPLPRAGPGGLPRHEAAYVEALRAALRDGTLTRREERHLARAAEHLAIGPTRALELREKVEREGDTQAPPAS